MVPRPRLPVAQQHARDQGAGPGAGGRAALLDEPFGALDARVRQELRRRPHDDLHVTSVFVAHDQEEALEAADRVVVMNAGRIEQVGTPAEIHDTSATPFVPQFLGSVNVWSGRFAPEGGPPGAPVGDARPHDRDLSHASPLPGSVPAAIRRVRLLRPVARIDLARCDTGKPLEAELARKASGELRPGAGRTGARAAPPAAAGRTP